MRYVNIEEYRHILQTGEFSGQVILHGQFDGEPFTKFKDWARYGIQRTNWGNVSGVSVGVADNLLTQIKTIEKDNKDQERDAKLEKIREVIIKMMDRMLSQPYSDSDRIGERENKAVAIFTETVLNQIKDDFQKYTREKDGFSFTKQRDYMYKFPERFPNISLNDEGKKVLDQYLLSFSEELRFGRANIDIFFKLKNDPNYIKEPGALRDIVNAITYLQDNNLTEESRQYEIALILDDKTFGFKSEGGYMSYETWGSFEGSNNKNLPPSEKIKGLLAAISIMPLKDLYQEMIDLEKGSGELAHPVFDNKGQLRWPTKQVSFPSSPN
ncbi:MAG: hypothetical protein AAB470_00015 [Patescibacteria group bacterium]